MGINGENFWIDRSNMQQALVTGAAYAPLAVMMMMGAAPAVIAGFGLAVGAGLSLVSRFNGVSAVKNRRQLAPSPALQAKFDEIKQSMGIEKDIKFILNPDPRVETSFAQDDCVILAQKFDDPALRDEAEFVIAHELTHCKHDDSKLGMLSTASRFFGPATLTVAAPLTAIQIMADLTMTGGLNSTAWGMIGAMVLGAVATPLNTILDNTASRIREFRADKEAVTTLGHIEGVKKYMVDKEAQFAGMSDSQLRRKQLFSTHPVGKLRTERMEKIVNRSKPNGIGL